MQESAKCILGSDMPTTRSILRCMLVIATALIAAPTSAADWNQVVASAEKEGSVVVYTALSPYEMDALSAGFMKKYPNIKVRYIRSNSGEAQARLDQERAQRVDGADVGIITEPSWYIARHKAGELLPVDGPSAGLWRPLKGYFFEDYVLLHVLPWIISWNTDVVKTPLTGYKDLLRPDLVGKIGSLSLVSSSIVAFYDWLDKNMGADYLTSVASQKVRMYASTTPLGQAIGSGEVGVGMFEIATAINPLVKRGAPIKSVFPSEVTFGNAQIGAALGWSKRPNAARVFLDYVLSVDGQMVLHKGENGVSPLGKTLIPESQEAKNLNVVDLSKYTPEVIRQVTTRWNSVFLK